LKCNNAISGDGPERSGHSEIAGTSITGHPLLT
jgi:hypothetical protein